MDASEYKSVVLGLIFLKYISDRFAMSTVISQCELWTDHAETPRAEEKTTIYSFRPEQELSMAAEDTASYGEKK